MARLACSRCGREVGAQEVDCPHCGLILLGPGTTVELPDIPSPGPESTGVEPAAAPKPVESDHRAPDPVRDDQSDARCPHCARPLPDPDAQVCVWCLEPVRSLPADTSSPRTRRVVVQFDGGDVELSPGETVLGRDPSSPAATVLARHDNVSRFHARIDVREGGELWVRDEGSSNGTFVDGRRLHPGENARLDEGTRLRLASNVEASVRFERSGGR